MAKKLTLLAVFATLFIAASCDLLIAGSDTSPDSEAEFETSQEFLDAVRSSAVSEFKLNNESKPLLPTNLTLTMDSRTLKCTIQNLVPNNGYVVTFFRNEIPFGFYRVRAYDVIWSTMNLNTILDFYPSKGALGAYPNFTVDISADSKLYGDYQCSVKLLGIQNDDSDTVYNSNRVFIVKEKVLTPELKWQKVFPAVNISFGLDKSSYNKSSVYEAKCKVRFDRPVNEYIVYFMASNKVIGAYMVQTDPAKVKWQLYARNLLESRHHILELEEESGYPSYVILIKPYYPDSFSCKIELPSKKHPVTYYSNVAYLNPEITVGIESNGYYDGICRVHFPKNTLSSYELNIVGSNDSIWKSIGYKTDGGAIGFSGRSGATGIRCRVTFNGQHYYSKPL